MSMDNLLRFTSFDGYSPTLVTDNECPVDVDLGCKGDARDELFINLYVMAAVTSGGAATVQLKLEHDDDENFGSSATIEISAALAKATLVAGYGASFRLPRGLEKNLRAILTIGTAALTAGTFFVGMSDHPEYGVRNPSI